jgi:putative N6-adenine-specific DNA methylase
VAKPWELFVACAPGLEEPCAAELNALGLTKTRVKAGGVTVKTRREGMWRANLGSAMALRVWKVLGRSRVQNFSALVSAAERIPWEVELPEDRPLRLDVHCKKSRLYHTKAVAERVGAVLESRGYELSDDAFGLRVQIRIVRDELRFAVDTSGASLDKRGWKSRTAKAPLRADLARAGLVLSGWRPGQPLLDPCCGSGTIALEAAAWASGRPTGWGRGFAFEGRHDFDPDVYFDLQESMKGPEVHGPIVGSDRDAGAVQAATKNAADGQLAERVRFEEVTVGSRELEEELRGGWLISNPPWGHRTGDPETLVGLYRGIGKLAQRQDMKLGLWSSRWDLMRSSNPELNPLLHTEMGGIKVTFASSTAPVDSQA